MLNPWSNIARLPIQRNVMVNNFTKLIVPPERTVQRTNLDELLTELRNQFTDCLAATKGCEDFQVDCWRLLIQLEREIIIKDDLMVGKYTLRGDSLDSIVIFKSDGEAGSFPIQKLEKKIDDLWDKEF